MDDLDGDPTDFSHVPYRGQSTRPNDFYSYFITEEDTEEEWIVTGKAKDVEKIRPYVRKHHCSLPGMGDEITALVSFKVGVNIRDVRDLVEKGGGAVGPNRAAYAL